VLGDRQVGRVAEDLVQYRDGLAPGGRDDLGAIGRVLIGDVGVGRGALVEEVPRQRPCGQAAATLRPRCGKRCPSEDDKVPPSQSRVSGCWWWALTRRAFAARNVSWRRYHCEVQARVSSKCLTRQPCRRSQGCRHRPARRRRGCGPGRGCGVVRPGMGERLAESGVAVDLDEQRGQMDLRQPSGHGLGERVGLGGYLLGGQRRETIRSPSSSRRASACVSGRPGPVPAR